MATATTRHAGRRGRTVVVGVPTRKPTDMKSATRQPPKDKKPTKAQVKKAREEWGIEPYVTEYEVIRPGNRGWIVHARVARKDVTLCGMSTKWVGGVKAAEHDELNCLWCMTRIGAFG